MRVDDEPGVGWVQQQRGLGAHCCHREREREGQSGRRCCLADPAFVHKMFE